MRCDVKNLNLIIKYCDYMASDIHVCRFMDAITRTFSVSEAGPPGFEPGSEAPEAPMLSKLYYEPKRI